MSENDRINALKCIIRKLSEAFRTRRLWYGAPCAFMLVAWPLIGALHILQSELILHEKIQTPVCTSLCVIEAPYQCYTTHLALPMNRPATARGSVMVALAAEDLTRALMRTPGKSELFALECRVFLTDINQGSVVRSLMHQCCEHFRIFE
eukprot:IDg14614t1